MKEEGVLWRVGCKGKNKAKGEIKNHKIRSHKDPYPFLQKIRALLILKTDFALPTEEGIFEPRNTASHSKLCPCLYTTVIALSHT